MSKTIEELLQEHTNLHIAVRCLIEGCNPKALQAWDNLRLQETLNIEKLPIGVMPDAIWKGHRVITLLDAIKRYVATGRVNDHVYKWMNEASGLLLQIKD